MCSVDFKRYEEAGNILAKVLKGVRIKEGMPLLSLAEEIEEMVRRLGGEPAFPCNLSKDREAAHNTPAPNDRSVAEGVIKVDMGVHVDGYIVDAALTVDLTGEHGKLVEAAYESLSNALSVMRDGVDVKKIGEVVDETARRYGFRPIENLGGHSIDRYRLHGGLYIPNIPKGGGVLREGMVVAVEPFISEGEGRVVEGNRAEIFQIVRNTSRNPRVRNILESMRRAFDGLPFARRWVEQVGIPSQWIRFMVIEGSLKDYPVLLDRKGVVAQAEATVIIEKDGVRVLVGPDI